MEGATGHHRRRHVASRFAFGVLSALVPLLVLELLLRAFDPLGISYFAEADRYFRHMEPNDAFAYIHRPYYRDTLEGVRVTINSHGFRGPEFETAKSPGVYRLLILGDSVVFGWGAPQDSIFPLLLQRRFDAERETVEVIPAGVGSWNTRTEYEFLKSRGVEMNPEAVLLITTSNDIVPNLGGRTEIDKSLLSEEGGRGGPVGWLAGRAWRALAKRSYIARHVQYFVRKHSEAAVYNRTREDSPKWLDARAALYGIIGVCHEKKIHLVVCLYTSEEKLPHDTVLGLYRRALDAEGVPEFMLPDVLFRDKRYRNSFVDGHANSRGQRLIADRVYSELNPMIGDGPPRGAEADLRPEP